MNIKQDKRLNFIVVVVNNDDDDDHDDDDDVNDDDDLEYSKIDVQKKNFIVTTTKNCGMKKKN